MDMGTAIGIACGFVQVIFDKYLTHILEKWACDVGLNGEYKLLENELKFIKTVLSFAKDKRGIPNYDLVKDIQYIQYLVYQAEDLLDEMQYYRIECEIENGSGGASSSASQDSVSILSMVISYIPFCRKRKIEEDHDLIRKKRTKFRRDDLSRRIHIVVKKLNEAGEKLYKVLNLHKLDQIVKKNEITSTTRPLKSSHLAEPIIFGRDEEKKIIIDQLIGEDFTNTNLSILPIVGNGGVGKTTLARLVFNDSKIEKHFELRMWIHVSVNYDEGRLVSELLEYIPRNELKEEKNLNRLLEILKKYLSSKKFLLALDDVWWEDNDKSKWESLLSLLGSGEKNGNVILLTTRKLSVAKLINDKNMIKLDGLEKNDFWKLFKLHAFNDDKYEKDDILHRIGEEICNKLSNYPLAAKTVGAMLRRNPNVIYWKNARDNEEWKSQSGPDDIMPALRLSYESLPFHLQRCFSFCSLFHKGFYYHKEELVNMWIAQGFFLNNSNIPIEDIGNMYFDSLVNAGFFEKVHEIEDSYVIHDLMHDLAQIVSQHDCFAIVNSNNLNIGIPNTIRHLSIITETYPSSVSHNSTIPSGNFEKYIVHIKKHLQVENLSTLIIIGRYNSNFVVALKDFLERLKGLRVLVIYTMSDDVDSLTCNFSEFIHLRYLQLHCCPWQRNDIQRDVLNNLNKLYHLEVININNDPIRERIKKNTDNFFWGKSNDHDPMFDSKIPWVGKLTALHELREFRVKKESGFEIAQLGLLIKLRGLLKIFNLENVESKEEAVGAKLEEKSFLNSLCLCWNREPGEHELTMDADVLEGLRPNYNLEQLHINGYGGATSPTWLANENSLDYLVLLSLKYCEEWEILPPLGHLLSLQKLQLWNMLAVKEIDVPFYGTGADMGFRALEEMEIVDMPKLEKWRGSNQWQAFPCLKKLTIENCPELTEFLNFEVVFSGDTSKNWFPHLHDLTIRKCKKLRYLSWESLCGLVNLKMLTIEYCPEIFLLFEPNEQSVENSFFPQSLEHLEISWCNITGKQLSILLLNLTNLYELKIITCRKITTLKVASITTSCFTNSASSSTDPINNQGLLQIPYFLKSTLKKLKIYDCTDLIFASKEGIGALTSIEELYLGGSNLLSSITNLDVHVNECCFLPPAVRELRLNDVPDNIISSLLTPLTSLLDLDIFSSPSLTTLKLPPCSTLKSLTIYNCENLVSLEGLLFPTQLENLYIRQCPNLVALNSVTRLENPNTDKSVTLVKKLFLFHANFMSDPICKQLSTLKTLFLDGDEIVDLTEEQEKAFGLLTSLEELTFLCCTSLNSLPNQLCNLSSLKSLYIIQCPSIQSLPENGLPPSLEFLYISDCSDELKRQCSNITSIKSVYVL